MSDSVTSSIDDGISGSGLKGKPEMNRDEAELVDAVGGLVLDQDNNSEVLHAEAVD